jgi:hypothetical protein
MMDVGTMKAAEAVGTMRIGGGWQRKDGGETKERNLRSNQLPCPASRPPPHTVWHCLRVTEGRHRRGRHARHRMYTPLLAPNPSLSTVERKRVERRAAGGRPVMGQVFSAAWSLIAEN